MTGSRVAVARKLRGLTQTDLANSVGVTQKAISKFEKEDTGLGDETVTRIAKALDFPPSFFELPAVEPLEPGVVSFRARSKMSSKQRDQALSTSMFGIELSDWMDSTYELPNHDLPDLGELSPEVASAALRSEWGLGESPISNMISLLELHGVRVFSVTETSNVIDAFSFWDEQRNRPFVFLSTSKSGERRRMDAAHELGHLVLHRKTDLVNCDSKAIEQEANAFASALLMPRSGFRSMISSSCSLAEVMRVKSIWKVSAAAVIYRAHAIGVLSDWQYRNMFMHMSKQGMRTAEPYAMEAETSHVAAEILRLSRESTGSTKAISKCTGIPMELIYSLMFHSPGLVVRGREKTDLRKGGKPSLRLV